MKNGLSIFLSVALWSVAVIPELFVVSGPNYALEFDGIDGRVQAEVNAFSNVVNSFTIELWANPTGWRKATAEANTGISDLTNQCYAVFPDHGFESYLGLDHVGAGLSIGSNGISVVEHGYGYLPSLLVYSNAISGWTDAALVYVNPVFHPAVG